MAAAEFPGGETDQRFKKQQYLDLDGICQVRFDNYFCFLFLPSILFFLSKVLNSRNLFSTTSFHEISFYCTVWQVGEVLEPNHVIVNKYSPLNQTDLGDGGYSPNKQEYKHTKMSYKGTAPSTVDKVMITSNENENFIIKVCSYFSISVISFYVLLFSSISIAFLL